jgi:hypothetical protein
VGEDGGRKAGTTLRSEPAPSPLVLALAEAVRGTIRNTNLMVDHAVAEGVPVLVPCACAVDIGDERCVCQLSLALPDRWMQGARSRRVAGQPVGPLPKRTCVLCRAGQHDLAPTYEMSVSVVGHGPMAPVRIVAPQRRSAKVTQARAASPSPGSSGQDWRISPIGVAQSRSPRAYTGTSGY